MPSLYATRTFPLRNNSSPGVSLTAFSLCVAEGVRNTITVRTDFTAKESSTVENRVTQVGVAGVPRQNEPDTLSVERLADGPDSVRSRVTRFRRGYRGNRCSCQDSRCDDDDC